MAAVIIGARDCFTDGPDIFEDGVLAPDPADKAKPGFRIRPDGMPTGSVLDAVLGVQTACCRARDREPVARMRPETETVRLHVDEAAVLITTIGWRMDEEDLVVHLLETALLIVVVRVVGGVIHVVDCDVDPCC